MKQINDLKDFLAAPDGDYVLTGHDNHIFLYAKNHYSLSGTLIENLRLIISRSTGIEPDYLSLKNIYSVVWGVFVRWVSEKDKDSFIQKLFEPNIFFEKTINIESVINSMISTIGLVTMVFSYKTLRFGEKYSDL